MPSKKWTACERGNCRAHRIACFHCKRIADKFCERHASANATKAIGGKRYCARGPVCERDAKLTREYLRTHGGGGARADLEFAKRCFLYATCEACDKFEIMGACAGRGAYATYGVECMTRELSILCAGCCHWTPGLDGHYRCAACFPIYAKSVSCASCETVTDARFDCSGCGKKACGDCDSPTEVDVSPRIVSGWLVSVDSKLTKVYCRSCMSKTTVREIRDEARREQVKRGLYK